MLWDLSLVLLGGGWFARELAVGAAGRPNPEYERLGQGLRILRSQLWTLKRGFGYLVIALGRCARKPSVSLGRANK